MVLFSVLQGMEQATGGGLPDPLKALATILVVVGDYLLASSTRGRR